MMGSMPFTGSISLLLLVAVVLIVRRRLWLTAAVALLMAIPGLLFTVVRVWLGLY